MEFIIGLIVQTLVFCPLCAYWAKRQNRERLPWVLLAVPLGIVALILLFATHNEPDRNDLRKHDRLRWR